MCGFPGNSSVLGKVSMYVVFRMGVTDFLAGSDAENNAVYVGRYCGVHIWNNGRRMASHGIFGVT